MKKIIVKAGDHKKGQAIAGVAPKCVGCQKPIADGVWGTYMNGDFICQDCSNKTYKPDLDRDWDSFN